jgi:hypothetical protein
MGEFIKNHSKTVYIGLIRSSTVDYFGLSYILLCSVLQGNAVVLAQRKVVTEAFFMDEKRQSFMDERTRVLVTALCPARMSAHGGASTNEGKGINGFEALARSVYPLA